MLVEHGQQPDSEIDSRRRSLIVCQSFKNCIFGQVESLVGIASQCCAVSYEPGELGFETLMKIGHLALLLAARPLCGKNLRVQCNPLMYVGRMISNKL